MFYTCGIDTCAMMPRLPSSAFFDCNVVLYSVKRVLKIKTILTWLFSSNKNLMGDLLWEGNAKQQIFKYSNVTICTFRWLLLALGKNYRLGTAHELISSDCLNQLICMRTCNAESQKRSAKGANFKRRQQGFAPLGVITPCLICSLKFNVLCWSKFFGDSGSHHYSNWTRDLRQKGF